MITPSGDRALDDFDFHQSSNRMAIECAFGMLVRRWGIFWRPLQVRFDRRASLIGACMRLHNFCIDHRLAEQHLPIYGSMTEIQPEEYLDYGALQARLRQTPKFDRDGCPVDHLDTRVGNEPRYDYRRAPKCARRDELITLVNEAGLVRPKPTAPHMQVKQKKKRGRPKGAQRKPKRKP